MGRRRDLSAEDYARVEAYLTAGNLSVRQIALNSNISIGSVSNIKKRLDNNTAGPSRQGNCGAKRKTSVQDDRSLKRMIQRQPLVTAKQMRGHLSSALGIEVSDRTVRRRLKSLGVKSVIPRKVPKLTPAMKKKRLRFAKAHAQWTIHDWRKVCFSDESTFEVQLSHSNRVWHLPNSPRPVKQTVKHPTKVMVWGMISHKGGGRLHVVENMMNQHQYLQVMQNRMLPQVREWFEPGESYVFMHDSAPCHKARLITNFLATNNVDVLDWPGNSPDLNPIENVWGFLKLLLSVKTITTKNQVISELIKEWYRNDTFIQKVQNSIDSMPCRMQQVISAKGGHTHY